MHEEYIVFDSDEYGFNPGIDHTFDAYVPTICSAIRCPLGEV